ncbi:Rha family transcriptional regulator [Burkholderia gladioli]|uniref:Rha family transcriptional regulator n=1 Tax=Burkholderia gladioli TaxID=28095 RepID=UPI00163FC8BE|nr:Rha family transcriptional regulator [Burkholderia gladioli]
MSTQLKPRVQVLHDRVLTTSLAVAEHFGRLHKNVIRDIERTIREGPDDFNRLNFEPVTYTDGKGEQRPMYRLTRDGFSLVAMGFTGTAALRWKIAYITAFNAMEDIVRRSTASSPAMPAEPGSRFTCDAAFHLRLLNALHQDTSAADLLWYLVSQGADCASISRSARSLGAAIKRPHSTVLRATNELERRWLVSVDAEPFDINGGPYRYRVLGQRLEDMLAEHEQLLGQHFVLSPPGIDPALEGRAPVKFGA